MKRRDFVQQAAIAGGVLMVAPSQWEAVKAKHVGVQIWSVRDFADQDPFGTLAKLSEMGYTEIEGFKYADGKFYQWSPKEFKEQLKSIGLKMTSAHTGVNLQSWDKGKKVLTDKMKKTIDDHAEAGVQQLICPHIDKEHRGAADIAELCEILNLVGSASKKAGMQFGYHNHDFEFSKINDKLMMDVILQSTNPDHVIWEMDLYWVIYANENPISWIKKYPGRIHAFHVKDMAKTAARETIEVGEGSINFTHLFTYAKEAGVKYYFIELENYRTTSLEGVDKSLTNLKKILAG